jgi:predicted amidophosphoribosyltransferase
MKTNIIKIGGEWNLGYVLDKHISSSQYLGVDKFGHNMFDTTRTEIGEAIYQLKYCSNLEPVDSLVDTFVRGMKSLFPDAGFIVPMPPSKSRRVQPVPLLAEKIAKKWGVPYFVDILVKNGSTAEMKNVRDREERIKALMEVFAVNKIITTKGSWHVLLIDDIYDFGSSVTTATRFLRSYGKINKVYFAAFTKTGKS